MTFRLIACFGRPAAIRISGGRSVLSAALCLTCLASGSCGEAIGGEAAGPGGLILQSRGDTPTGGSRPFKPASDGTRVFTTISGVLTAFDLLTGATVWTYVGPGTPASISVANGRVMWTGLNKVTAVGASNGSLLWQYTAPASVALGETDADGGSLYLGTDTRLVIALNAATGVERWSTDVGPSWTHKGIVRGLRVAGDTVYAAVEHQTTANGATGTAEIFALDRATGAILWQYTHGNGSTLAIVQSAVRVAGPLLLFELNWLDTIVAIDRFTKSLVWIYVTPGDSQGPLEAPEVDATSAYSGSYPNVRAFNLETGQERWKSAPLAASVRFFGICGSRLLVNNGALTVIDKNSGAVLGTAHADDSGFPISDMIVVGNTTAIFTSRELVVYRCPD